MWITRNYDPCSSQCPCYHKVGGVTDGSVGGPLWQGALELSRAAMERQQETKHSQKILKGYTEPTPGFLVRTGTI